MPATTAKKSKWSKIDPIFLTIQEYFTFFWKSLIKIEFSQRDFLLNFPDFLKKKLLFPILIF